MKRWTQRFLLSHLVFRGLFASYFLLYLTPWADAGQLGFQMVFKPQSLEVTNVGDEQVFHLRLYTLDPQHRWRVLQLASSENGEHLNPRQRMQLPYVPAAARGLEQAGPILVVFQDAAGSELVQLAWRVTPALPPALAPFERVGEHVLVHHPLGVPMYRRTWAIAIPSEGIAALASSSRLPFLPPQPPVEMLWNPAYRDTQVLTVHTGKGQRGVWLVHEAQDGTLYTQTIGDGVAVGSEQKPDWLKFLKNHGFELALALGLLGLLLSLLSQRFKRSRAVQHVVKQVVQR